MKKHRESITKNIKSELIFKKETIHNINFIGSIIEASNADMLKKLCVDIKNDIADALIVLGSNIDGKPFVAIGIADDIVQSKNIDANKIIKEIVSPLINGGSGQKTLATAGGQDISKPNDVIVKVQQYLLSV